MSLINFVFIVAFPLPFPHNSPSIAAHLSSVPIVRSVNKNSNGSRFGLSSERELSYCTIGRQIPAARGEKLQRNNRTFELTKLLVPQLTDFRFITLDPIATLG